MKIEAKERVEEAEMKRDGVKVVKDVVGVSENILKTKEENHRGNLSECTQQRTH